MEEFRAYMDAFGWKARFVFLGLQVLQVVIALIPGELLEMGAGYTFGAFEGTLLCMAGVALGSSLIFWLTQKFGIKLVEVFISREKINELRFINSEKKLKRTLFLVFFIPGTPKDLLTYFAGLTRIKLHEFLLITLIARIPSVVSSTIGGHVLGIQQYSWALAVMAITGIISLGGLQLYNKIIKHRRKTEEDSPELANTPQPEENAAAEVFPVEGAADNEFASDSADLSTEENENVE